MKAVCLALLVPGCEMEQPVFRETFLSHQVCMAVGSRLKVG